MKKLLLLVLFAGFGLLPLWATVVFLLFGSHGPYGGADFWNTAPWLFFVAVPLCAFTLGIATVTTVVFAATTGSASKKYAASTASFFGLIALTLGIASRLSHQNDRKPMAVHTTMGLVAWVQGNQEVIDAAGGNPKVSVWYTREHKGAKRNVMVAYGQHTVYPIVDVAGSPDNATFTLACVSMTLPAATDASKDVCGK
jgi:hypothetical protein